MSDKITIIRATKNADNPYVVLRKAIPQDKALSWEARGMLSYILSQPDNWKVIPKNLEQKCGKSVVYRILNELIAAGYIKRKPNRDQNQRFKSWTYEVYEVPQPQDTTEEKEPLPKKPEMAQPEMENRDALLSTDSLPSTKKDSTPPSGDVPSADADNPSNGHEPTPKKERPRNEWYDAIMDCTDLSGELNGRVRKMLEGKLTAKHLTGLNLKPPMESPDELRQWFAWWQSQGDNSKLSKIQSLWKLQSNLLTWRHAGSPSVSKPEPEFTRGIRWVGKE